jgi:peptide deformylase
VEAQDVEGNKFTYGASGLMAHIFQHEIEHLDGILFTDHGYDLEEYSEADIRKNSVKK